MAQDKWQERIERKIRDLRARERDRSGDPLEKEFEQIIARVIEPAFRRFRKYCEEKGIEVKIRIGDDPPYAHFALTGAGFFPHYSISRALHFSVLTRDARAENKVEIFEESWREVPAKERDIPPEEFVDLVVPKGITSEFVEARLVRLLDRYLGAKLNY
jgi:signal transduction histidine kinase